MTTTHFDPKATRPADNNDALAHLFTGPHAGCFCDCCNDARAVDAKFAGLPDPIDAAERDANVTDMYAGHGGTAAHTPHHEGPSDKQMRFLARLADERGIECPTPATKKAASAAIDRLLAMPIPATTATPAPRAAATGRFTKINGVWAVRVTGSAQPGDVVTVTKGDGSTKQVRLGAAIASGVYVADDDAPKTTATLAAVPAGPCPEGIHRTADGTIYKVYRTQTTGNLAAKRLVDHGDHGVFEYAAGAIRRHDLSATTLVPHDEAARFGQIHGFCCACGRSIDTEESLAAGYGPSCARRYGWPWGRKQLVAAQ